MAPPISAFYRIWFTTINPILTTIGTIGIIANIFAPSMILNGITPNYSPPTPETTVLLYQTAGFFAMTLAQELYIRRVQPNDVNVWRAIEGSTALVDVGILAGVAYILRLEERMGLGSWRQEEWINVVITAGVLVIRGAFLAGVGFGGRKRKSA